MTLCIVPTPRGDESTGNVARDPSEHMNTDEEIILKCRLNKHDYNEWTGPVA